MGLNIHTHNHARRITIAYTPCTPTTHIILRILAGVNMLIADCLCSCDVQLHHTHTETAVGSGIDTPAAVAIRDREGNSVLPSTALTQCNTAIML